MKQTGKEILLNLQGLEEKYIDYKGREVPAVSTGFACGCKKKCTELLGQHSDEIFVRLRSIETKNGQDIFLQSLITSASVKTYRPRKQVDEARIPRDVAFKYQVLVGDIKDEVMY